MTRLIPAMVFLALLHVCPAQAAYPMRVTDARGKCVAIPVKPIRIIPLTPNMTEILFALGLGDRIVGVNSQSDYPAAAKKKPGVGDMTISAEAVVVLKPDLVLAHAYLNREAIGRLEKLKLRVFALDPKTIAQVISDIRTVGKITARPRTAEKLAVGMEREIASVRTARAKKPSRDVLVVIQSNPLWVAGPKTFVDEMLGIAHARSVARDARPGFVPFSRELAIARNPDVIIVGMKSDVDYFLKSPEWRNTKAVKAKRVYFVNNDLLVRPCPRLVAGLKELASRLGG
jgi:iron complex transport system substrate-binding protein